MEIAVVSFPGTVPTLSLLAKITPDGLIPTHGERKQKISFWAYTADVLVLSDCSAYWVPPALAMYVLDTLNNSSNMALRMEWTSDRIKSIMYSGDFAFGHKFFIPGQLLLRPQGARLRRNTDVVVGFLQDEPGDEEDNVLPVAREIAAMPKMVSHPLLEALQAGVPQPSWSPVTSAPRAFHTI